MMLTGVWSPATLTFSMANGMTLCVNETVYGSVATNNSGSGLPYTLTFGNPLTGYACGSAFPNQRFYGSIDEVR